MAFVGKLANLVLFPGLLFIALTGLVARAILGGMSSVVTGASSEGPGSGMPGLLRLFADESVAADGALRAVQWIAPVVKLAALSWVTCIIFGYRGGDLALVFALLAISSAADVLVASCSSNPRVRQSCFAECARSAGWGIPLALVLATVALRTGQVSFAGVMGWQSSNGILIAPTSTGVLTEVGVALSLAAAALAALGIARLRPLSPGLFDDPPGGITADMSGPPLAMLRLSDAASLFTAALLLAALFFAGPASTVAEVAFWVMKVAGITLLMGLVDIVSPELGSPRALALALGAGGVLAVAGLILVWIGSAS